MITNQSVVALTSGDPGSISPVITLKAWLQLKNTNRIFFLIADINYLKDVIKSLNMNVLVEEIGSPSECTPKLFSAKLPVLHIANHNKAILGVEDNKNTPFILKCINKAVELANKKQVKAIVTNPVNKALINTFGVSGFYGHTNYIFNLSELKTNAFPIMLLSSISARVHVVPLTTHIPLAKVAYQITQEKIIKYALSLTDYFSAYYNITNPPIYILGLNPHAGENGILGTEEIATIIPAIQYLKKLNINVIGPVSADTVSYNKPSIIMGMYHDQVLAPFKALYLHSGINSTLNLGFIRTSPAHGTCFDLLKNIDNLDQIKEQSLIAAITAIFLNA